jgi:O-antigen/teichoic acid export membrane protein
MMNQFRQWLSYNRSLISNSGSLIGAAIANSGLGFLYWWLAALSFEESVVGLASASVSAMVLLGSMAMLGLGTLLVGELPKHRGEEPALITTALAAITAAAVVFALIFAVGAALLTHDFDVLTANLLNTGMFVLGVILTAITLMLDQAFIGLLRGEVQFTRNMIASVVKVVLVFAIGRWIADQTGMWIFSAWVLGMLVSMITPFRFLAKTFGTQIKTRWCFLRELGTNALIHHWLNLALDTPIRILPVIVTVVLSPATNASFYVAWMIAGLMFFPVQSLTLVLYAVSSQDSAQLAEKTRMTLRLAALIGVIGYAGVFIVADLTLGVFGASYALTAGNALRIVSMAIFPLIIKDHFVAIHRIQNRTRRAAVVITVGGFVEIVLATVGGIVGGLNALSAAWVCAIVLQAIYMAPTVFQTARVRRPVNLADPRSADTLNQPILNR